MINKILLWISIFLLNISIAFAQTGLFGDSGGAFLTVGVIIIIAFVIIDQIRRSMTK